MQTANSITRPTVIVTRPARQAERSVARLQAAGFKALSLPALEILLFSDGGSDAPMLHEGAQHEPIQQTKQQHLLAALQRLADYDLIVFVSPNAVLAAMTQAQAAQIKWPTRPILAVMGPGSLAELAEHGIRVPEYSIVLPQVIDTEAPENTRYDSESLLRQLDQLATTQTLHWQGAKVLVLRGTTGRDLIIEALQTRGAQVDVVPCYERRIPTLDSAQRLIWQMLFTESAQQNLSDRIWVVTSSESLRNLLTLAQQTLGPAGGNWLRMERILVPHVRIAEQARTLGFRHIQLSGAGDSAIIQHLQRISLSDSLSSAASDAMLTSASNPSKNRLNHSMDHIPSTQQNNSEHNSESQHVDVSARVSAGATQAASAAPSSGQKTLRLLAALPKWILIVVLALLLFQAVWTQREINRLQKEVARRMQDSQEIGRESKALAQLAQDTTRDIQARTNILENRIAESRSQQVALEQLYQELARSRDEWALTEIEQILGVAAQQLQLAGNVQGAIIALQTADNRLARSDRPQFLPLRRIIARDMERLKAVPFIDIPGLAFKLDNFVATVDTLPLLSENTPDSKPTREAKSPAKVVGNKTSNKAPAPVEKESFWAGVQQDISALSSDVWHELEQLVKIRKVEQGNALLVTPEQAFFLRENLKLRLLNARLALLARNEATYRADLKQALDWYEKYFDTRHKAGAAGLAVLRQLQSSTVTIELPSLADSLSAVREFKPVFKSAAQTTNSTTTRR